MSKLSIIIPCYFASQELVDMTKECLGGLKDFPGEIIVVDDGSPIKATFDGVVQVALPENQGYAAAINVGLDAANGDTLIICNNDITFVDPHWLHHLTEPLSQGYDICSTRTTDCDGWETRDWLEKDAKFGSIFAMKRAVHDRLGGFDERFRGYFTDLDYRRRALNAEFKIVKNHNGLVEHHGKATYKQTDPNDKEFAEMREAYIDKWGFVE